MDNWTDPFSRTDPFFRTTPFPDLFPNPFRLPDAPKAAGGVIRGDLLDGSLGKVPHNLLGQNFIDFPMARNRLRGARLGVVVDVMLPSMPEQLTTKLLDFLD